MSDEIETESAEIETAGVGYPSYLDDPRTARHAALQLAHDSSIQPAEVVQRAEAYHSFIVGGAK